MMTNKRARKNAGWLAAAWILTGAAMAAEYRGTVKVNGAPLSGAAATAVRGDLKLAAATGGRGQFVIHCLADGAWTVDVEMFGFEKPAADKTRMAAAVSFFRAGAKAFETAPVAITEGLDEKSKAVPVSFTVPLEKLKPGHYTCQVSVLEPGSRKFTAWRAPVVALP